MHGFAQSQGCRPRPDASSGFSVVHVRKDDDDRKERERACGMLRSIVNASRSMRPKETGFSATFGGGPAK